MLPSWDPGATLPTWKSGRSYIGFPNVYLTLHCRNKTSILNRDGVGKVASPSPRKPNPLLILARIALYGASVFLVFTVTLGCFPAITMLVQSTGVMQCSAPSVTQTDLYIISIVHRISHGSNVVVVNNQSANSKNFSLPLDAHNNIPSVGYSVDYDYIISNSTSAGSQVVVVDRLLRARGVFRSL